MKLSVRVGRPDEIVFLINVLVLVSSGVLAIVSVMVYSSSIRANHLKYLPKGTRIAELCVPFVAYTSAKFPGTDETSLAFPSDSCVLWMRFWSNDQS